MIDDLTVWSVLQDDRLVLHSAQVQVKDWIDSTVLLVQPILDRKQQDIQIVCPESGVEVAGDARYLTHILLNLLVNAARYSKNHDQIIIRVVAAEQNVRIAVIDQGPGVAKEDQKRIFQRYERGKRARTSDPGGLGLGLYIVNRLITLHGGSFGLDSEVGKGATFWFTLPQATIATTDHEDLAISTRESETHREDFTC